jgi:FK506-binding nuclear protein
VGELPSNPKRSSVIVTINDATFTLCSLVPEKIENQRLDIYLAEEDQVTFHVLGNCPVDITGNNVAMLPDGGADDDEGNLVSHVDIYGDVDDEEIDSDAAEGIEEMDEDEEDSDDSEAEMEFDAALMEEILKRKAEPIPVNTKKAKITEIVEETKEKPVEKEENKESVKAEAKKDKKSKESQKKQDKPEKETTAKTLPSGLIIEDHVVGKGPQAKSGSKVISDLMPGICSVHW